jgi:hypothetical protein
VPCWASATLRQMTATPSAHKPTPYRYDRYDSSARSVTSTNPAARQSVSCQDKERRTLSGIVCSGLGTHSKSSCEKLPADQPLEGGSAMTGTANDRRPAASSVVLGVDIGTTSTKVVGFDPTGRA